MDKTYSVPTQECPACGTEFAAASGVCEDTPAPRPGDVTVCIECAAVMLFCENLTVRVVDPAKIPNIHPDDLRDIRGAQRAIRRAQAERQN